MVAAVKAVLAILQPLVFALALVRVTSPQCMDGEISEVNIQEWEGGLVFTIQVCVNDGWMTPCLSGWSLRNSMVVCRELRLPTKQIGYYMEPWQENTESYLGFGCNISGDSLIDCNHWEVPDCQCGVGIFCGNISSDQSCNSTTSWTCATCEDPNVFTASEQITTASVTNIATPKDQTTLLNSDKDGNIRNCNLFTNKAIPLIFGVLGGLCVILGVALVGVVFCLSATCWKLHRMSVSRSYKEKEVTSTNTIAGPNFTSRESNMSYDYPDLNSSPHTSGNKVPSKATYQESNETERLVVDEVDCKEVSVLPEARGGEGQENQGKEAGGSLDESKVFYHVLEKPQEYEQYYTVVGKNDDKDRMNEILYKNVETKEPEMYSSLESSGKEGLLNLVGNEEGSHENTMHCASGETDGKLRGQAREGNGEGRKLDKSQDLQHVLKNPQAYEEFYSIVGSNKENKTDEFNEAVYKNVERKKLKMKKSSERETVLSKAVGGVVNCQGNTSYFESEETGGGRQGEAQGRERGRRKIEGQGRDEREGGERDECEALYNNLAQPHGYEEFYKVLGEDELDEAVYDIVERKRLEMYSSLCHSLKSSTPK